MLGELVSKKIYVMLQVVSVIWRVVIEWLKNGPYECCNNDIVLMTE